MTIQIKNHMHTDPLSIPNYEVVCPECNSRFFLSIGKVVAGNFTHCPECKIRIEAQLYYSRPKVVELMQQVGYQEAYISVNDNK